MAGLTRAAQIRALLAQGLDRATVAERMGVRRDYVATVERRGEPVRPRGRPLEPRCDAMADQRRQGASYQAIAEEFRASEQAVWRACRRRGVP